MTSIRLVGEIAAVWKPTPFGLLINATIQALITAIITGILFHKFLVGFFPGIPKKANCL